jgi:excisionase family DNA binding protein
MTLRVRWRSAGVKQRFQMESPYPIAVTIPDAVKASGISRTSIYEALKRGDLTARKAGRRTLISFADLQAYLASLPAYQAGA